MASSTSFTTFPPPPTRSLHVGQVDRLTFFGPADTLIRAFFVDCRRGSPTLHQRVDLTLHPDPRFHLVIERGIGHLLYNKSSVTVRNETLWYAALDNPDYDLSNDSMNFRVDDDPANWPVVDVNDLPLPDAVLQYVLSTQQRALIEQGEFSERAARVMLGGARSVVSARDTSIG
ncbi:hypothetical protein [Dyella subtropica]|uniref:hypothetical protein n=1 Tax=Dyella subtropica TaxID=2992127 RepID=UPI00224D47E8|nr:hypothetical protein [Dyella subtropica]